MRASARATCASGRGNGKEVAASLVCSRGRRQASEARGERVKREVAGDGIGVVVGWNQIILLGVYHPLGELCFSLCRKWEANGSFEQKNVI